MFTAMFKSATTCLCKTTRKTYNKTKGLCPLKLVRSVPVTDEAFEEAFEEVEIMQHNGSVMRRIPREFVIP